MADKAFMFDSSRCCGCRSCHSACKLWNELPAEDPAFFAGPEFTSPFTLSAVTWNHMVFSEVTRAKQDKPGWNMLHKKCFHCRNANCFNICPAGAISKKDGWTIIDQNSCISCGLCNEVCVYNVPHLSKGDHKNSIGKTIILNNKTYKCNACRVNIKEIPACVENCPTGALTLGHRQHILKESGIRRKKLSAEYPEASVYGIREFGGLRMICILKDKPEKYGLPTGNNAKPVSGKRGKEIKNLYTFFALFTFGSGMLKRKAVKLACRIEYINRHL